MKTLEEAVVIYHGYCYDGFGAAWAAWKKYGDSASYIPCTDRNTYPEGITGKEVYVVDFCFDEKITKELQENNKKLVVLDHHVSAKNLVQSLKEHVFSEVDSGAKIAWKYFHPGTEVPLLIEYISDSDTWAHALPSWKEIGAYIHAQELEFYTFSSLNEELAHTFENIVEKGAILNKQFEKLVNEHIEKAVLVEYEQYTVYAVNASSFLRSELGHKLALKKGPFSIVYRFEGDTLRVSLRGDGSVDCTKLVEKYGGGGHHDAAALILKDRNPLPFSLYKSL